MPVSFRPHPTVVPRRRGGSVLFFALQVVGVLLLAAGASHWLFAPVWNQLGELGASRFSQPTRLFGQPLVMQVGAPLDTGMLVATLQRQGYRPARSSGPPATGRYRLDRGQWLAVGLRAMPTPGGVLPPRRVEARLAGGRLVSLRVDGQSVASAALEPPLLATLYDPHRVERRPVTLADLNNDLVRAVLAAEDDTFFRHGGLSLTGVLRALWVDLKGGEIRQGGSTITQQLARNLFLTQERTVARKVREAALAVMLELELSKWQILEHYLNVVYLGAREGVSIVGVGAGARAYFGKDAREVTLAEAAALAGMIASPATASPLVDPQRCRERRDRVLQRLVELGWADLQRVREALAEPVDTAPAPVSPRHAPYFAALVQRELVERWHINALEDTGLSVLTTLSLADQDAAEGALRQGLTDLEQGRRHAREPLQGALVSLDPRSGAILAYLGGRHWESSQFDRAGTARRPPGSAFKPVVYAAAFQRGLLSPASFLEDTPLTLRLGSRLWSPQNDDDRFLGSITARRALEESRNVPAVRAALAVGLPEVAAMARHMGVTSPLDPLPSLALGAFGLSPLELATVYATLAASGVRPCVHGITAVLDAAGRPVPRPDPSLPKISALTPAESFLLTSVLQGVMQRGTGRGARAAGLGDPLAGKTGTSNHRRDAWFAGYSPERATVVWVGYDSNAPTGLSGASGPLPIWTRFTKAVRPPGGYSDFPRPAGVVKVVVDPSSGALATTRCPVTVEEYFLESHAPTTPCPLHTGWRARPLPQDELPALHRRFSTDRRSPRP